MTDAEKLPALALNAQCNRCSGPATTIVGTAMHGAEPVCDACAGAVGGSAAMCGKMFWDPPASLLACIADDEQRAMYVAAPEMRAALREWHQASLLKGGANRNESEYVAGKLRAALHAAEGGI